MAISKIKIRLRVFNATTTGFCRYCGRPFGRIDLNTINTIQCHHQNGKTMNLSRACGYGFNKAMEEFIQHDCIWLHTDCHKAFHKKEGRGPRMVN